LFLQVNPVLYLICPSQNVNVNMKTVVNRNESNFKQVVLNKSFKSFADDAGFKPITCRLYRPKTKGLVIKNAGLNPQCGCWSAYI